MQHLDEILETRLKQMQTLKNIRLQPWIYMQHLDLFLQRPDKMLATYV
jgi:hypothetical protein